MDITMSTEYLKLEKDLCRCCHSEGSFISLSEPYVYEGVQEIFTDMLRDVFNLNMAPVIGTLSTVTYTICEACILRLRDATNFKKQVLLCEERFKDMYSRNVIQVYDPNLEAEVKIEVQCDDDPRNDYSPINENDEGLFKYETDSEEDFKQDASDDSETQEKRSKKAKTKSSKTKKTCKKPGRPRKLSKDEVPSEVSEATKIKKDRQPSAPKFYLRDEDFTKDGNVYNCTRCDKKYEKIFSLRFHVKSKHYKIPKFICPVCSKEFMTLAPLTVHKLEEHNIDDRFKCKACPCTFNTKVQLRKHINNFHMLGERYKCEFCDYESFSFEGMYKHKFKHKTVKDYHCRFCRKSFLRKTTLDLHERIHTGDRRKVCKVCGQAFVQKASLNYHMTKYHPEVNY